MYYTKKEMAEVLKVSPQSKKRVSKMSICKRRNTCFECDDKKCLHAGDITADCPLDERTRLNHCIGECHECKYSPNNWKAGEQK